MNHLSETHWRATKLGLLLSCIFFFFTKVMCAAAALMAFYVKILAVGMMLIDPSVSKVFTGAALISFMCQCMGCITMEVVLQDRLMLFAFGGQDATYQDDEHAYKHVYECRLAKQIWTDYCLK
jgi:hypothetical protein